MVSLEIMKRDGRLGLFIRDYPAQGINPNYVRLCDLNEETAELLIRECAVGDMR